METKNIDFPGELREIEPSRLIDEKKLDEVEIFFLTMGLFYNDLKSLTFYLKVIGELDIKLDEISIERGEYGGMKTHLGRMIVGTIYEFFDYLKKKKRILKTEEFRLIYDELNLDLKARWDLITEIARGEKAKKTGHFSKILVFIRNNLAFHYSQEEPLRQGFINAFYLDDKNPANEKAFYSTSAKKAMDGTRFFYCDAAAQRAFRLRVEEKMDYDEFIGGLIEVIDDLNFAIMGLMYKYIRQRPSR